MNDEQMKVARELAGHPRFEWRAGMLADLDGDKWRIDDLLLPEIVGHTFAGIPDLTDDATGGVLWAMAGRPFVNPLRLTSEFVWDGASVWVGESSYRGATLAEACARLLLAQWAREVTP